MSTTERMSPQEHAELVRDANALINAIETGISRTGAVYVAASVVTLAALALGLTPVAAVVATVAVLAFAAALLLVVTRISLGPAPEPLPEAATEVAQVAERPATGSAPATSENRRNMRK
jgi:VIT1/CCC1 family predicted Fe2+/Mn2+ transporter